MASTTELTVVFDGEAMKDHRIDVRDLAPSLLALGQTFEEANRLLNGNRAEVRVFVRATAPGSFEFVCEVAQSFARQVEAILAGNGVTAALNLRDLIVVLIGLIKMLRGQRARRLSGDKGDVVLEVDGEKITVSADVVRLLECVPVRTALRKTLEPLQREGIDTFEIRTGAQPMVTIHADEISAFDVRAQEARTEPLPGSRWTSAYSIVSLAFKDDNKWRLTQDGGETVISASIADDAFLGKVNAGLEFAKGDALICEMVAEQTHTANGVRTEYKVERVIEHRRAPRQLNLVDNS